MSDLDQHLTNLWPRYDYDASQILSIKYTIKWPWYDQPMTKIWPGILGLSYEWKLQACANMLILGIYMHDGLKPFLYPI